MAAEQEKFGVEMNDLAAAGPSRTSTDAELGKEGEEEERERLLHADDKPTEPPKESLRATVTWMVINTLATIGIVSLDPHSPSHTTRPSPLT